MRQTGMKDEQLQREFEKSLPVVDTDRGWERLQAALANVPSREVKRCRKDRRRTVIAAVAAGAGAVAIALIAAAALGVFADGTQVVSVDVTTTSTGGGPSKITTASAIPTTETTGTPEADHEPVMTTSPWAVSWPSEGASKAAEAAIAAWPPGIEAVLLSTGYELYVVSHDGIRWSQEMQARPEGRAQESPLLLEGVAVSNNQQYVAYVEYAADIVVRSITDGVEVGRVAYQAEGYTQLRGLSLDGNLVVLDSRPPDVPKGTTGDRMPWRVTLVNMRSGEVAIEQPLEDLVKERTAADPKTRFTLYSLDWLSEERLLVDYSGQGQTMYVYDIQSDAMEPIPGMSQTSAISAKGDVYGWSSDPQGPRPVVWNGSTTQVLELDVGSAYALGGAFNSAGDALAIQVMTPTHRAGGWQLFRLSQGRWERSGPVAENSWMKAAPRALSADGTIAYAALEGGLEWKNGQNAALLSHDFRTGVWQEWLGPDDLLVGFGQFPFVAIIPR